MARVECEFVLIELEDDFGNTQPSVKAICSECGHEVESYGQSSGSMSRCLAVMRDECPEGRRNYYVEG